MHTVNIGIQTRGRHWGPWHDHAHDNNTDSLRASSPLYSPTQGFLCSPQDPIVWREHPFDFKTEYFLCAKEDVLLILSLSLPILFCDLLVLVCVNGFSLFCRFITIFRIHTWFYCEVSKHLIEETVKTTEEGKINRNYSWGVPGAKEVELGYGRNTMAHAILVGLVPMVTKGSIHRYMPWLSLFNMFYDQ